MANSQTFIDQGIDMVKKAIEADNSADYETALGLYKRSLDYFMTGLKYEKNPTSRNTILQRVEGYMKRAEVLDNILKEQAENKSKPKGGGNGGTATQDKDASKDESKNDEDKKLRGNLASAIVTEKPNIKWDDVAGLEQAKQALKEAVILPVKFKSWFTGNRKPWKGILLYGPPGTGKSYLAKAVATEADCVYFSVSSADLVSKWQGESERLVKQLFEMAHEAGNAIIFIDEVDSLCGNRSEGESDSIRRIKTEFLVQMDGVGHKDGRVLVLGATNIPWELDPAIRRRFEKKVYIPLPEKQARITMLKLHIGDTPNHLSDDDFQQLAEDTDGCSGADCGIIVREALMEPLRKCQTAKMFIPNGDGTYRPALKYPNCPNCPMKLSTDPPNKNYQCTACGSIRRSIYDFDEDQLQLPMVTYEDFLKACQNTKGSVGEGEITKFVEWTEEFGMDG